MHPDIAVAKFAFPSSIRQIGLPDRFGPRPAHTLEGEQNFPLGFIRFAKSQILEWSPWLHTLQHFEVPAAMRGKSK